MIKPSEFFSPDFINSSDICFRGRPQEQVSEMVNEILENIETNLAQGTLVFTIRTSVRHVAMVWGENAHSVELKNSGYLQLINELINDKLSEFGWVAYISTHSMEYEYLVKLAIKDSELELVKQQIK